MNQEIKAKWIAALRSGQYKQGTGTLRTSNDKFCCLGVLADLHRKEVGGRWEWDDLGGGYCVIITQPTNNSATADLPRSTRDWAGLESTNPMVYAKQELHTPIRPLAAVNDSGYTFDRIADIIEQQL